jgi:beta-glucosidase
MREIGEAIAEEAADQGVSVVLGPGVNIKRGPLCGRNFEYFSEDPCVSGKLGAAFVSGLQGAGVGACLKHFAANSQEKNRMVSDSVIDEFTLRSIYLPAFEEVVRTAKPAAVMCSYNKLNGTYASENRRLLTEILRDEWGYDGVVVSDWGATADRVAGIAAGLDLEMPGAGGYNTRRIMRAVKSGALPEAEVDKAAARVAALALRYSGGRAESDGSGCRGGDASGGDMYERHHVLARRAAAESAVLLRNRDGALPLRAGDRIAVIGSFAKEPRYQGAGSSVVNPARLDCAWDELLRDFPDAVYAPGYVRGERYSGLPAAGARGSAEGRSASLPAPGGALAAKDLALIGEAADAARGADVAVVFAGLPDEYESEGFDRESLAMPETHSALIRAVCGAAPLTVVVIQAGSPVDLAPADDAGAILYAYLGGQAGGGAIADILTGRVNPSGRLAETFPLCVEDTPCHGSFGGEGRTVEYREGVFVGYRHYESKGVPVAYPFGHGLSYTAFEYSGWGETVVGDGVTRASVTVTNTGDRAGADAVLFYDEAAAGDVGVARELHGFAKVFLRPGESAVVTADIVRGPSSCAARSFDMRRPAEVPPAYQGGQKTVTTLDANSTLGDLRGTVVGAALCFVVRLALRLVYGGGAAGRRMADGIVGETPLRTVCAMSGGLVPRGLVGVLIGVAAGRRGL